MNKIRKTLVVVFSALFVLCMALFAVGCDVPNTTTDGEAPANSYSVSVDVNDASLGEYTITGADEDGGYAQGTLVTVTVTPKADYEAEVYVNGEAVALENGAASFSVEADTTVQVKYTYKISAGASVMGGEGEVTLSAPADGSKYASGENVTVTATPAAGYTLKSLSVNGTELTAAQDEDGAFVASFEISEKSIVFAEFVALRTVTVENDGTKGAADVKLADGTPVASGSSVAEGTLLTLTVAPVNGNTVKAVYIAGALTALKEGKVTFAVKGDTEVKVEYDTYYNVSIPDDSDGGTISLTGGEKVGSLGYLEGTVLTLTVKVNDGYTLSITKNGADITLVNGKYTFTVTEAVAFDIRFIAGAYTVETLVNNDHFGSVALVNKPDAGTYAYNSTATFKVTPEPGYVVDYVTVNGEKLTAEPVVENEADLFSATTYTITVKGDTVVFVCLVPTERFTVTVELGRLFAKYEANATTLTALKKGITLGGNGLAGPNDEFISFECYQGQTIELTVTASIPNGDQLFYYLNGETTRQIFTGEYTFKKVTSDQSIRLTAEAPAKPTVTLGSTMDTTALGNDISTQLLDGITVTPTIVDGNYTFMLEEPESKVISTTGTAYLFKSWTVKNGENELHLENGAYSIPYVDDAKQMALTITANWVTGYKVPDSSVDLKSSSAPAVTDPVVATATLVFDEGTIVKTIDNQRYAEAGANFTATITPKDDGYRVTTLLYTYTGGSIAAAYDGLGSFSIGAQNTLTGDMSFNSVVVVKIYSVTGPDSENVTFSVGASDPTQTASKVRQKTDAKGQLEPGQENIYWVDEETSVNATVTAKTGYYLSSVKNGSTECNLASDTTCTIPLDFNTLTDNVVITATAEQYLSATVKFLAAEGLTEALTTDYTLTVGDEEYTAADKTLKKGDKLTLTLTGDTTDCTVVVKNGEAELKGTDGVYVIEKITADITLNITITPDLNITFPTESQGSSATNPAPVQGDWTNLDSSNSDTLAFGPHSVTVNGEAVIEIAEGTNEQDQTVYTLKTESGDKYTLEWFAGVEGYILMLKTAPADPAPAPAGRRNAPRAASDVTYFVAPKYAAGSHYDAFASQADRDALVGIDVSIDWTSGTGEEADHITVKSNGGYAHISLNGDEAQYVFCVDEGHYLFVIGTSAYDMVLVTPENDDTPAHISINNEQNYFDPATAKCITEVNQAYLDGALIVIIVTVQNYTSQELISNVKLVCGSQEYAPANAPAHGSAENHQFQLHFNQIVDLPAGTYALSLEDGTNGVIDVIPAGTTTHVEVNTRVYELQASEGDKLSLVITDNTPAPTKSADGYHNGTISEAGAIDFFIHVYGYQDSELTAGQAKLVYGDAVLDCTLTGSIITNSIDPNAHAIIHVSFNLAGLEIHEKAELKLRIGSEEYSVGASALPNGKTFVTGGKAFAVTAEEEKLYLAITAATTQYTVHVTATGEGEGCSYTLQNSGVDVADGSSVTVGTTLTLTLEYPDTHKVTVTIGGSSYTQADKVYTITVTAETTIDIKFEQKPAAPEVVNLPAARDHNKNDIYASSYFYLYLGKVGEVDGVQWLTNNHVTKVLVDDASTPTADNGNAGFHADGTLRVIVMINGLTQTSYNSSYTLHWYNADDQEVATTTVTFSAGEEQQGTITGPTDVDLVQDAQGVWLVVKGTFVDYDEAGVKAALGNYHCDLQQLSGVISGDPNDWSKQARLPQDILSENITISGSDWSIRFDLLNIKTYAYCLHFGPTASNPEDVKIQGVQDKDVEYGGRKYSLVNKYGEAGQLNYWGCVGLRITNIATAATVTATSANLETTDSAVNFVLSGTYQDIDASKIQALLETVYFDFQELDGTWTTYTFDRAVTVEGNNWTIKFDITKLPVNSNAFTGHFLPGLESNKDNPAENLTLTTDQLPDGTISVTLGEKKYTLVNKNGSTQQADNWGCVSVKVEDAVPVTDKYVLSDDTIEKVELVQEGDKVLYVVTTNGQTSSTGYSLDELQSSKAGNNDNQNNIHVLYNCVSAQIVDGKLVLKYDITQSASQNELYMNLYKSDESNITDVHKAGMTSTVAYHGKNFSIKSHESWASILLTVAPDFAVDYTEIKVVLEGEKPVLKLDGTVGSSITDATYMGFDLQSTGNWLYVTDNYVITVADGKFTVTVQLSSLEFLSGDGYLMHLYAGGKAEGAGVITVDIEDKETKVESTEIIYQCVRYVADRHVMVSWGNRPMVTLKVENGHNYQYGVCQTCHYVCAHTFTSTDGQCSECGYVTGHQIEVRELGNTTNSARTSYTMTKPANDKVLEIVYSATFSSVTTINAGWTGVVTQFFDGATSQAFLQGNCNLLILDNQPEDPWVAKANAGRTLAEYGDASKLNYTCRVTVLWVGTTITVTYHMWKAGDNLRLGADKTGSVTFSNLENNTYIVSLGQDNVSSENAKLVVNEYALPDVTETKTVSGNDIPTWVDPYQPRDVAMLMEGTTVTVTGQFADAGNETWNGLMYWIRNGISDENLYVFRQAGDCATAGWTYGQGLVDPGFMGDPDPADRVPPEDEVTRATNYINLKKNAKFEVVVTYLNSTVTIKVTVFGNDDAQTTDDQVLSVVLSGMTIPIYKFGLVLDGATLTEAGLSVTTTTGAASHSDDAPVEDSGVELTDGRTVTFEGTVSGGEGDDVIVELALDDSHSIFFCKDGLRSALGGDVLNNGELKYDDNKKSCVISGFVYDNMTAIEGTQDVSIQFSLSGTTLTVTYTVGGHSYSGTINDLSSVNLSVVSGNVELK